MSSKKSDQHYIKYLQSIIENVNVSHSKKYNIQAVAMLLNIPIVSDYNEQCSLIINYLKKNNNSFIKNLLKNTVYNKQICNILVNSLYTIFYPDYLNRKAPIKISEKKYLDLIKQYKDKTITKKNSKILSEAMNVKYCHCLKKIYLKNQFTKYIINSDKSSISGYPLCMSSIYNKRNIKPPFKVSHSCREKYKWYK